MSSYVVEDATINRVVSFLQSLHEASMIRRELLGVANLITPEGEKELAVKMFALNWEAVLTRYPQSDPDHFRREDFRYSYELATEIQAYKSLTCWLYQCAEGNIPETNALYKAMDRVKDLLANELVTKTPEYEKAYWG